MNTEAAMAEIDRQLNTLQLEILILRETTLARDKTITDLTDTIDIVADCWDGIECPETNEAVEIERVLSAPLAYFRKQRKAKSRAS